MDVFEELKLDIPEDGIDRAHGVGKKTRVDDGPMQQPLVVKLHSWKNRVAVYHARKKLEDKRVLLTSHSG